MLLDDDDDDDVDDVFVCELLTCAKVLKVLATPSRFCTLKIRSNRRFGSFPPEATTSPMAHTANPCCDSPRCRPQFRKLLRQRWSPFPSQKASVSLEAKEHGPEHHDEEGCWHGGRLRLKLFVLCQSESFCGC